MKIFPSLVTVLALGAVASSLSACGPHSTANKSGAGTSESRTITVQLPDGEDAFFTAFQESVAKLSGGRLTIKSDTATYASSTEAHELPLVDDLKANKVEMGSVPTRDLAIKGYAKFQAVQAPFLLTTVAQTKALAASSEASVLLKSIDGAHGLTLAPLEPRQLESTKPVLSVADLANARVRIVDNNLTAQMFNAIGATPVPGLSTRDVGPALKSGALSAAETSPTYITENAYEKVAPYLSSWAMFPKLTALVASPELWTRLSASQRSILSRAATRAAQGIDVESQLSGTLSKLCDNGLVIVRPSQTALNTLAAQAKKGGPTKPEVRSEEKAIRRATGATSPALDTTSFPKTCTVATTAAAATKAHAAAAQPTSFTHRGGSSIPDGTYVTKDTAKDFHDGGQTGKDWNKEVTWTWVLHGGRFNEKQTPDYPDQGPVSGTYTVKGPKVTFHYDPEFGLTDEVVKWSFYQNQLTFQIVSVDDSASRVIYSAHPWTKTG
ncbi:MAG: sialic acid-binding protein [Glaciihabitans sp.]|jgi:TRAP-type C4-dicarboxylate transport system substrate-binding protein|nr:sialic acid-binding protein [Glaciihabitans sp.]